MMVRYITTAIVEGKVVETGVYNKPQSELTGDCFPLQFMGLRECEGCKFAGKDECGGGETLKKLKRALW